MLQSIQSTETYSNIRNKLQLNHFQTFRYHKAIYHFQTPGIAFNTVHHIFTLQYHAYKANNHMYKQSESTTFREIFYAQALVLHVGILVPLTKQYNWQNVKMCLLYISAQYVQYWKRTPHWTTFVWLQWGRFQYRFLLHCNCILAGPRFYSQTDCQVIYLWHN